VAYYLSLFTVETWQEFKAAGGKVSGFRQSRWGHVKKLKPDDRLLGYLVGAKRWVAVLRVTSEPYIATEPKIWAGDDFSARVDVEIEHELTPETGVPIYDVLPELTLLDKIKDKKRGSWGAFFIGSPSPWSEADAKVVVQAIQAAAENPVHRDLPKEAFQKAKPKAVDSGTPLGEVTVPDDVPEHGTQHDSGLWQGAAEDIKTSEHTEIQALLMRLGRKMGHKVFAAVGDQNRLWQGKPLSQMAGFTKDLPTHFNDATHRIIKHIDVLWLDDNAIAAAFEVERTTSIYSGLLRMSDLLVMQPNLDIPIFLVAPESRHDKVLEEVNRPTFKALPKRPLHKTCRYISFESLTDSMDKYSDVLLFMSVSWLLELSESCDLANSV
jgi:hypothetical protein